MCGKLKIPNYIYAIFVPRLPRSKAAQFESYEMEIDVSIEVEAAAAREK